MISNLPKTPPWKETVVTVEGGTMKKPIMLQYRRSLDVFRFLYGNPTFADLQENAPYVVWEDDEMSSQVFEEPNSSKLAWELQVCLHYMQYITKAVMSFTIGSSRRRGNVGPCNARLR